MTDLPAPPQGFEEIPPGLKFADVLRPLYRRVSGEQASIGMWVQAQHTNMIGICHGGVLMTLSDIGASWGLNQARDEVKGAPTINLGFDFISAAREGDWIQANPERVEMKKHFGFASGVVVNGDEKVICRFSGTFYFPDHEGFKRNIEMLEQVARVGRGEG